MNSNLNENSAQLPLRHWYLIILALSGFVTSFGAHIVATNLPAYAQVVGVGAFTTLPNCLPSRPLASSRIGAA